MAFTLEQNTLDIWKWGGLYSWQIQHGMVFITRVDHPNI